MRSRTIKMNDGPMKVIAQAALALPIVLLQDAAMSSIAHAGDGRLEISQTCAIADGCFPGDTPGFPIRITTPGSYIVTSDLVAGANLDGIRIETDSVTLDMNGFRLLSSSSTSTSVNGIEVFGQQDVEIRNGTVEGFRGRGVFITADSVTSHGGRVIGMRTLGQGFQGVDVDGGGHLISNCTSVNNTLWGFSVDANSIVSDSVAENNGGPGLQLEGGAYRNTVVSNNNGGNTNAQIIGTGVDLGGNLCGGNASCP